jgi:hypothetical protein
MKNKYMGILALTGLLAWTCPAEGENRAGDVLDRLGLEEGSVGVRCLADLLKGGVLDVFGSAVGMGRDELVRRVNKARSKRNGDAKSAMEVGMMNRDDLLNEMRLESILRSTAYRGEVAPYVEKRLEEGGGRDTIEYLYGVELMVGGYVMKNGYSFVGHIREMGRKVTSEVIKGRGGGWKGENEKRLNTIMECVEILHDKVEIGCAGCCLMMNMLREILGELLAEVVIDEALGRNAPGDEKGGKSSRAEDDLLKTLNVKKNTLAHSIQGMGLAIDSFREGLEKEREKKEWNFLIGEGTVEKAGEMAGGLISGEGVKDGRWAIGKEERKAWDKWIAPLKEVGERIGDVKRRNIKMNIIEAWKKEYESSGGGKVGGGKSGVKEVTFGTLKEQVDRVLRSTVKSTGAVKEDEYIKVLLEGTMEILKAREADKDERDGKVSKTDKKKKYEKKEEKKVSERELRSELAARIAWAFLEKYAGLLRVYYLGDKVGIKFLNDLQNAGVDWEEEESV